MTAPAISITDVQTLTVLRSFLLTVVPDGTEVVRGQDNMVAPPVGSTYLVTTPILHERLATNITSYHDGALDVQPAAGERFDLMESKVTVQVDVHGPISHDIATTIAALFRSTVAIDQFATSGFDVTPLYASEPKQVPFLNDSQQIETRWTVDLVMQCNPIITTGQDFADTLTVGLINVDATYPPSKRALSIVGSQIVYTDTGVVAKLRGWNWGIWDTVQPQDAMDAAVSQGATIVRIPLRWWGLYNTQSFDSFDPTRPLTGYIDYKHLEYLDAMMAVAAKAKLYIILFTDSQCGQSGLQPDGFGGPESMYCDPNQQFINGRNFWTDPGMLAMFIAMWEFLAARYAGNPYWVFAEPMVEPNPTGVSNKDISKFYQHVFAAIRAVAPGILLICGGQSYQSNQIGNAYIAGSTDVVYTADMFMQFGGATPADNIANFASRLANLQLFISTTGAPVLVQQTGVTYGNDQSPLLGYTNAMLSQLNAAGLPWVWWTYRDPNTNGFGPYYQTGDTWGVHTDFLAAITGYMQAPLA